MFNQPFNIAQEHSIAGKINSKKMTGEMTQPSPVEGCADNAGVNTAKTKATFAGGLCDESLVKRPGEARTPLTQANQTRIPFVYK
jgi:hypothetical protein